MRLPQAADLAAGSRCRILPREEGARAILSVDEETIRLVGFGPPPDW